MKALLVALGRSLRSLLQPGLLWHLLWPGALALLVWLIVAVLAWEPVIAALQAGLQSLPWIGDWLYGSETAAALTLVLVKLAAVLGLVPLVYVTAALLVAVIALPLMLERVARSDYAELELRRGGSNLGSAWNAVLAAAMFLVALLLSLPFWLIPGVALGVPVLLTGWLNQRAFGYDALMMHADAAEMQHLRSLQRGPMLVLGSVCALLAYVPLLNLIVPAYSGLVFVHFMLEALRRERLQNGVVILDPRPANPFIPSRTGE